MGTPGRFLGLMICRGDPLRDISHECIEGGSVAQRLYVVQADMLTYAPSYLHWLPGTDFFFKSANNLNLKLDALLPLNTSRNRSKSSFICMAGSL